MASSTRNRRANGYGNGNGNGNSEEHDRLADALREEAAHNRDAGAGFLMGGVNPYAGDWDFDLTLPECPDVIPKGDFKVDARLIVGIPNKQTGRMRQSTLKRVHITEGKHLVEMRESMGFQHASSGSWQDKMREWNWATDPFDYGVNPSVPGAGMGILGQYVPLWPGPVTRQLYWSDYFAMSAKAFEAYNHDPISWRAIHMKQEFVLGKGIQAKITYSSGSKQGQTHENGTAVWDEYWTRNKMDNRMDMFCRDLCWGGEQFMRYFPSGRKLTVRSLDPASIYDLITDPEDLETVFAYHQQFQAPYQLYPPRAATPPTGVQSPEGPTQPGAATRYIIRQILPQEVDHYRINISAYERRGRSDLYPGLGWIKRLRDYLTSHVVRADLLSRICWDLVVDGNQAAVQQLQGLLFPNGSTPPPGSVFAHNSASELKVMMPSATQSTGRYDPMVLALATMIGNSIGIPADWIGFSQATTRANALVATEPASHSLEDLQGTLEGVIHDQFNRVMAQAKITDAELEVTFPSIAAEDRSQKLQDLSFSEANGWLSKQSAAQIAAKELGFSTYDFADEQKLIAEEFPNADDAVDDDGNPIHGDGVIRTPMIIATNRQAPKLDPTKSVGGSQDEPPGLLVTASGAPEPAAGAAPPSQGGPPAAAAGDGSDNGATTTRGGVPSTENPMSAAGAASIKNDNLNERTYTQAEVDQLMREAKIRRRPDNPEFAAASAAYQKGTQDNLSELVQAAARAHLREAESEHEDKTWWRRMALSFAGKKDETHVHMPAVNMDVKLPDVKLQEGDTHVHVPDGPAPEVHVHPEVRGPDVRAGDTHVYVPEGAAPQVNVEVAQAPSPDVHVHTDVHVPEPKSKTIRQNEDGSYTAE